MSSRSVALFEAHRRREAAAKLPTTPAPRGDDPIAQLEREQRRLIAKASRAFAKAQDLQAQIDLLKGKTCPPPSEPSSPNES